MPCECCFQDGSCTALQLVPMLHAQCTRTARCPAQKRATSCHKPTDQQPRPRPCCMLLVSLEPVIQLLRRCHPSRLALRTHNKQSCFQTRPSTTTIPALVEADLRVHALRDVGRDASVREASRVLHARARRERLVARLPRLLRLGVARAREVQLWPRNDAMGSMGLTRSDGMPGAHTIMDAGSMATVSERSPCSGGQVLQI
jgi:hypothetical protein